MGKISYSLREVKEANIYLLLAEFSIRTVNYGPSFFPSIYSPSEKSINRWKKTRIRNLQYGPKNEANRMFIIWLLPVWGPETSAGRTI